MENTHEQSNPSALPENEWTATEISDSEIGQIAMEILESQPPHAPPIRFGKFGLLISEKIGRDLRSVLKERKLASLIRSELDGKAVLDGSGKDITIRLASANPPKYREGDTFLRPFWAAFIKPITVEEGKRFIKILEPIEFRDFNPSENPVDNSWIEVENEFIVGHNLTGQEKSFAVRNAIQQWCSKNCLSHKNFLETQIVNLEKNVSRHRGLYALTNLIQVIPEKERSNYNLPLNLIYRLLVEP